MFGSAAEKPPRADEPLQYRPESGIVGQICREPADSRSATVDPPVSTVGPRILAQESNNNNGRLILVSNRLPLNITKGRAGLRFHTSVGGLATGLRCFCRSHQSRWIGWCGIAEDLISESDRRQIQQKLAQQHCHPVFLNSEEMQNFYEGFCNATIWPLFHYFPLHTVYEKRYWTGYKQVNERFCRAVTDVAEPGDSIWIHDYQLMLLPQLVRRELPDCNIGFFLHIPFPSFEIFRLLPWRRELLQGLLGADLLGFHTYDYVRHFLSSTTRLLGAEHSMGLLNIGERVLKVDAFPMGIDYDRYARAAESPDVKRHIDEIRRQVGDRRVIISVDRLDYTKGIVQRLEAFDLFLSENPHYKEKVTMILLAVPSRTGIRDYAQLRRQLEHLVGRINGEHGVIGWVPVWYLYRAVPFARLVALYTIADVALITPLRDGMNLVAKEFLAAKSDGRGVLILSEMAGAASELGEAIIVNANNKAEIIAAIKTALEMPPDEQITRNRLMQKRLARYNIERWASDFLQCLADTKDLQRQLAVRNLTPQARRQLLDEYRNASTRLLLLDYDGTLVGFVARPEWAGPDRQVLELLESLAADARNELVVISGRDRDTLERWLGGLRVSLIAEHGGHVKQAGQPWQITVDLNNDWKDSIRPILELYSDRTPGSFVEEKDFSLVWHFRRCDPELAGLRRQELKDAIVDMTENLGIGVYEGSKILEVKNVAVSKGHAARPWLDRQQWQFILAAGDDYTDEDLFTVLPQNAYSIRIGGGISKARYNIDSVYSFRELLKELALPANCQKGTS